jgi:hypothetical protein
MNFGFNKLAPCAIAAALCLLSGANLFATDTPLTFVAITPCRVVDTRNSTGALGGPILLPGTRDFPILSGTCGIPNTAVAYSINVTAIPAGHLSYLTIYASGQDQPLTSTLNDDTGTIVANEVTVSAGTGGSVRVYVTDETNVILDVDGYFIPDTSITFQGAWSNSATYAANAAVSYNSSSYISLVANNTGNEPDTSTTQWSVLAQQGAAGAAGATGAAGPPGTPGPQGDTGATGSQGAPGATGPAGLTFQGAWSNSHTYALNDAAYYSGSSYLSLVANNTGHEPDTSSAQWTLLAEQGATGSTGAPGPQGTQGIQGIQGPAGTAGTNGTNGTNGPTVFSASVNFTSAGYYWAAINGLNQTPTTNDSSVQVMPGRTCSAETITAVLATANPNSWSANLRINGSPTL